MPNARLSERAPFFAEVDVVAAGLPAPRRLWGSDVSETGMFLQTTQPFHIGDRVSLRFDVAEREVHIRAAEVMWVRPFEPINVDGKLPGVGLKFVALDPPARAALRRFVQPQLADTQPEHIADADVDPHAMVSLPPFSQPPLNISLPEEEPSSLPEHVRVFKQTKPSPVTIGPKQVTSPPTLLIGWSFRKEREDQQLDLRFDDAPPDDIALSTSSAQPVLDVTSTPPEGVTRDGSDTVVALDRELEEGIVAIKHLPVVEARRTSPAAKKKSRALETAVALLVAGCVIGSGIGYASKRWSKHEARLAALRHTTPKTATKLPPNTSPLPSPTPAESAPPIASASGAIASTTPPAPTPPSDTAANIVTTANAPPVAVHEVKSVVEAEAEVPMMKPDPVAETLTDGGPALLPRKHGKTKSATIKVGDAEVTRVFALENPSRIVVDLNGGKLPKDALEPGNGIEKIRFGHPAKGKGRVVVELAADKKPKDLRADVDNGTLTVSFK